MTEKPSDSNLDVIRSLRDATRLPIAAYNVSGEYSAVKAAAERGWLDEAAAATNLPWGWFWFYELAPDHFSHLGVAIVYAILAAAALVGGFPDVCRLEAAARDAAGASRPIDDKRGTGEYRKRGAGVLTKRAATIAYDRAKERG